MTKIFLVSAAVGILAMGGCAQVTSFLASPTTTQAAANVETFTKAFACGLSAAAAAAQGVATQPLSTGATVVDSKGQQIIGVVYASSTAACQLLGGVVVSPTPVSVSTAAVVK